MIIFGSTIYQTVGVVPKAWTAEEVVTPPAGAAVVFRVVYPGFLENPDFDPTQVGREPAVGLLLQAESAYLAVLGVPVCNFVLTHTFAGATISFPPQLMAAGVPLMVSQRLVPVGYYTISIQQSVGGATQAQILIAWSISTL